jgi:hypothetical protein
MTANRMIRPFIPPAITALRPFMLMTGGVVDTVDDPGPAGEPPFEQAAGVSLGKAGFAGQREGEARAREAFDIDRAILQEKLAKLEAQESITTALDRLLASRDTAERALEHAARSVLVSALRRLFPVLLASAAGAELTALIGEALAIRAPGTLGVRAHPGTLAGLAGAAPAGITLTPDPSLAPGAAEMSWSGGGLSFDPAGLLERMATLLVPADPQNPANPVNKDTLP